MEEKRATVGKISLDLQEKIGDNTHSADEQMREQLGEYEDNIKQCVDRYKNKFTGNFYVIVATKKERLLQNVIRNYFFGRKTCPTPEYDQVVYRYDRSMGDLELLWVVPAKDVCSHMITNALELPVEERELLNFVIDFLDGALLRLAKRFNGESDESPLLVKN